MTRYTLGAERVFSVIADKEGATFPTELTDTRFRPIWNGPRESKQAK